MGTRGFHGTRRRQLCPSKPHIPSKNLNTLCYFQHQSYRVLITDFGINFRYGNGEEIAMDPSYLPCSGINAGSGYPGLMMQPDDWKIQRIHSSRFQSAKDKHPYELHW